MYEDQTYETILARMLGRVDSRLDKREGSVIYDALSPAAVELGILYIELDELIKNAYGDTASREYLIRRAAERGISPYPATCAVLRGSFIFTESPPANFIGSRFNISDLNYTVTQKISDGVYKVMCETPGSVGNSRLGTMTPIVYVDGLVSAELTALIVPGEDEEDTEALRERYLRSFTETPFGGNRADYLERVSNISGVGAVKLERVWNGDIRPASMRPSATVQSWYTTYIESVTGDVHDWLAAVYAAALAGKLTVGGSVLVTVADADDYAACSDELIESIQTAIDPVQNAGEGYGIAPIGHAVTVQSAEETTVDVTCTLTFNTGYTWESLKDDIESAVGDYLLALRRTWADNDNLIVRISRIESAILDVQGVLDVSGVKINGSAANLTVSVYGVPVLGEVSQNE